MGNSPLYIYAPPVHLTLDMKRSPVKGSRTLQHYQDERILPLFHMVIIPQKPGINVSGSKVIHVYIQEGSMKLRLPIDTEYEGR
jgi:hypothetical protein